MSKKIKVTDIIPACTRGQLCFIASFIYYLFTFAAAHDTRLINMVSSLYTKIDRDINIIKLDNLQGFSQLEYVRREDMIRIINRMRSIDITF
jgi:hypothetical protein